MEAYNQIVELLEEFHANPDKNVEGSGNKAAGLRARKAASELKKAFTDYRKESIETNK